MMTASFLALVVSLASVIPPLSPEQKAKLEAVKDRTTGVDAGFYELLRNASEWPAVEEPSGAGLNAAAMLAAPVEYRGLPFIIEGEYLGLQEVHMVKESGPWNGKIEQWGIRVPSADATVMVFLTNPPPVPVAGQKVTVVGRFYKVWSVKNEASGRAEEYLVFVGRGAKVHAGLTLPPLSDADRQQIATATDFDDEVDRGPLYPLLKNAAQWKDLPMPAAPLITHGDPIIGAPGEYRGLPLRIEGALARRQEFKSSRSGAWDRIEQWVVEITPKTKDKGSESVIVYLVDPPDTLKVGEKVRVVGRFYKVWRTYLAKGEVNEPYNFVVLVGANPQPLGAVAATAGAGAPTGGEGGGVSWQIVRMALGAALVLAFGFFMVRRYAGRIRGPRGSGLAALIEERRAKREGTEAKHAIGNGDDEPEGPPLPPDPAEALLEMERRRLGDQ